jgi:hypothetical protein
MGTSILDLEPVTRLSLRLAIEESIRLGIQFFITSTVRSFAEQLRLFLRFKAGLSRFPAAPPGKSTHQLGIAVDLVPKNPSALDDVVELMFRHGFKWAGPRDRVHFTHQGRTLAQRARVARRAVRRGIRPEPPSDAPTGPVAPPSQARFPVLPICHS